MPNTVQLGPYRPQLVEPERFELLVEDGIIQKANLELGYVNRGIEKLFTTKTYEQNLALAERICGICSGVHTLCYSQTVEDIMGIDVPPRARYLRTIYMELERLHSHYLWFGVLMHSLQDHSAFAKIMGEREQIQDLMEYLTGNRLNYAINTLGGVRRDVQDKKAAKIREVLVSMKALSGHILSLLESNCTITEKTEGVGVLLKTRAMSVGAVGPTARASGIRADIRVDDPYAAYGELDFDVITDDAGDTHAKALVRARETLESIGIVRQALSSLPEGEILGKTPSPRAKEAIGRVEAPRGELFYYISSNGSNVPNRVKVRTPSFANNLAVVEMLKGEKLDNARTVIESIDPCFACTDRVAVVDLTAKKRRWLVINQEASSWLGR